MNTKCFKREIRKLRIRDASQLRWQIDLFQGQSKERFNQQQLDLTGLSGALTNCARLTKVGRTLVATKPKGGHDSPRKIQLASPSKLRVTRGNKLRLNGLTAKRILASFVHGNFRGRHRENFISIASPRSG